MDKSTWQLIISAVSAIGTLGAVIVALYLAHRDRKIRLTVRTSRGTVRDNQVSSDVVWVAVANIGLRSATVTTMYWKIGFWKPVTLVQFPTGYLNSGQLPKRLADGDTADFLFQLDTFTGRNMKTLRHEIEKRWSTWWALRTMKIGVTSSAGGSVEARIDSTLRDHFTRQLSRSQPTARS